MQKKMYNKIHYKYVLNIIVQLLRIFDIIVIDFRDFVIHFFNLR